MAEAAEIEQWDLKDMTKDDDKELPESIWSNQLAAYYGNTPGAILTKFQEDAKENQNSLAWLIDVKTSPYQHYFFSTVVPAMTGVSLCFMAEPSLQSNYGIYLHDASYKLNPKAAQDGEWKAKGLEKFYGFKSHQWQCEKTVINEETLEETPTMTVMNENLLFWTMHQYHKDKPDTLTALKKLKFPLAGNQYKVVKVDTSGAADCAVSAAGNGECLCAVRTKDGILVANWADNTYKGAGRRKWGSLKGKNSQFFMMIMDLAQEFELLTIDGDGYK
jgi:hypothetical protein